MDLGIKTIMMGVKVVVIFRWLWSDFETKNRSGVYLWSTNIRGLNSLLSYCRGVLVWGCCCFCCCCYYYCFVVAVKIIQDRGWITLWGFQLPYKRSQRTLQYLLYKHGVTRIRTHEIYMYPLRRVNGSHPNTIQKTGTLTTTPSKYVHLTGLVFPRLFQGTSVLYVCVHCAFERPNSYKCIEVSNMYRWIIAWSTFRFSKTSIRDRGV